MREGVRKEREGSKGEKTAIRQKFIIIMTNLEHPLNYRAVDNESQLEGKRVSSVFSI